MDRINDRRRTFLVGALLGLITLAVYWPVSRCGFIDLDDTEYITENSSVRAGLNWGNVKWAFQAHSANWHPLTWLSHMLDVQLFGLNAGGHHLTSVFLHTASALLLFQLFKRMTGAIWPSAMVAALFALHPLHVESVAWVAERKDVLSAFFFMLTLMMYAKYAAGAAGQGQVKEGHAGVGAAGCYLLCLVFFVCGLMSKTMLVTLPFVLLLLDVWPLRRIQFPAPASPLRLVVLEKIPFLLLSVVFCFATLGAQDQASAVAPVEILPVGARLENAVASYLKYLGKTLWPAHLSIFYPHPSLSYGVSERWPGWLIAAGALLLVAISAGALLSLRRRPWLAVGWFWYLGMLVPVIGIIQVGKQAMADRYTYLPLIGVFIGAAWGLWEGFGRRRFAWLALVLAGAAAVALSAVGTRRQLAFWQDNFTVFGHAISLNARNPKAQFSLGQALVKAGREEEGIPHLRAAIEDEPGFSEAHFTLAVALARLGRIEESVREFQTVLALVPGHANAVNALTGVLVQHGSRLMAAGHTNDAAVVFAAALDVQPELADKNLEAGKALAKQGKLDDALSSLQLAAWLKPGNAKAHEYLGIVLGQRGQSDAAIVEFRRAIELNPDEPVPLNNLAWILASASEARLRGGAEAVKLAERACRVTEFKQALFISTLAAAYAEAGRFEEAVATGERARDLAKQVGWSGLAQKNEQLLELFRSGKAYHEPARNAGSGGGAAD